MIITENENRVYFKLQSGFLYKLSGTEAALYDVITRPGFSQAERVNLIDDYFLCIHPELYQELISLAIFVSWLERVINPAGTRCSHSNCLICRGK